LPPQYRRDEQPVAVLRDELNRLIHGEILSKGRRVPLQRDCYSCRSTEFPVVFPKNPLAYEERAIEKLNAF